MRLATQVEDVCHAEIQVLGVGVGHFEPVGPVEVHVFDEEWVEGVQVPHEDLVFLGCGVVEEIGDDVKIVFICFYLRIPFFWLTK